MIKTASDESTTPGMYHIGRVNSCNEDEQNEGKHGSCARVVLTISAKDLRDLDPDETIDPYCVVSICDALARTRDWKEIGRTETVSNTTDPEWSTKICLTYYFEEQQRLHFEVYDGMGKGKQRLGTTSILLHEIVGANHNRLTKPLYEEGKSYGMLTVTAEELSEGRQESVYFVTSATNLDRKDFLGKCDPFLKISRINVDNTLQLAYRSRYHEQTLNPRWKPFEILTQQLCYEDKDREFQIECLDWDQDGNHDLVGSCKTTVNRLLSGLDRDLPLINEKKARKKQKYTDSGTLHFHKIFLWSDFTFLDFISGGTELDFTVAIDFTRSNLPMDDTSSLHHLDGYHSNQYEIAINAIADICQHYSRSKVFNAYGFGAKIPPGPKTHYNFPLNLETNDPRCYGISGLLHAYLVAQSRVELSGPTDFTPTIKFAARRAASIPEDGSKYCVLLIITDGAITDLESTKEEIIKASSLPLSIIIIGVGYDTFEEMKELDADNSMLSSHGKFARRDIVQFVQLRKFLPPHRQLSDEEKAKAKANLAKEVLFEVPGQLVSYMKSKGIYPRPISSPFERVDADYFSSQTIPAQTRHGSVKSLGRGIKDHRASFHGPRSASSLHSPRGSRRLLPTPPDEQLARTHFFE
ncbi:copine domain-containing protein [Ditylenchus destructor]|nr:copine domain-containing protein [Ditylenchus destructor]